MSTKTDAFISKIAPMAIDDYKKTKVLPSLTIAQAILESGWGESALATKANNLFGIKAGSSWTGKVYNVNTQEYYDGKTAVTVSAYFRVYDDWSGSIKDHSDLLQTTRYKQVLAATSYKEACEAIYVAGYATDPNYTSKLISLIQNYNLAEYDKEAKQESITALPIDEIYRVRKTWTNASSQLGAYSNLDNAKKMADANPGHFVFNGSGESIYPSTFESYLVKVTADSLNVRQTPSGSGKIVTSVKKDEVYTIVEAENNWGKLKSGAGWISLRYTTKC